MSPFDPMAVVVDWLDHYRAQDLSIVELFARNASLECGCNEQTTAVGHHALTEFWRRRFAETAAGELVRLEKDGDSVHFTYSVSGEKVQVHLNFNDVGEIAQFKCRLSKQVPNLYRQTGTSNMSDNPLDVADPSGLSDADCADIKRLQRAYTTGGEEALLVALDELATDPIRYVHLMRAIYPEMISEAIRDELAEHGMDEKDLRDLIRKLESPAPDQ